MAEDRQNKQGESKTMTQKNYPLGMFIALLLLLAAVVACSSGGNETEKANKLVDEGNAAVQEAKKDIAEAEQLKQKMLKTDVSQLDEARSTAKEAIAAYEKAEAKCKEAAAKYDEASRLKLNDKFKEYLALKVKEYNKRAELVSTAKGVPQALIDSESRQGWIAKANSVNTKVTELGKEADDLGAQADKIQKDNPDIFKS
jgi:competence protein ComGC